MMATQNPIEQEGTYPLPEAQLDRFLLKLIVGYSTREELSTILDRTTRGERPKAEKVLDGETLIQLQALVREAHAAHLPVLLHANSTEAQAFGIEAGVDVMAAAVLQNNTAQIIIAHQAGRAEGEGSLQAGQINGHIVRRTAGPLGLTANVRQLIALRINVNDLDLIDDPIASGQQPGTSCRSAFFHCHCH